MELSNPFLIVIDPGHGGHDNGAHWNGRLEKDDNLRLGLAVRDALARQSVETLMTRDSDVFIPLSERVNIANRNDADLFVSLHRNSYVRHTPTGHGVENYIYLTAPEATAGQAARLVLDQVVDVGVQSNRGVSRGNYYVLRRTRMPAMLLEMGFINDDEDNRLFDQNLQAYAEAIARGVMEYFDLPYEPPASVAPPIGTLPPGGITPPMPPVQPLPPVPQPPAPTPPGNHPSRELVAGAQQALNRIYGSGIAVDGVYGPATKRAAIRALQSEINDSRNSNIPVDGVLGPQTRSLLPTLRQGDRGSTVSLLQILLALNGYDPGAIDGIFGPRTRTAVTLFQRDNFLIPDGVAGPRTFSYLLR